MKTFLKFLLVAIIFTSLSFFTRLFGQKNDPFILNSVESIAEIAVNSVQSDFGPCVINDSLYFTTYNNKLTNSPDNKQKKNIFYDLYRTKIDKNGNPMGEREPVEAFITRFNDGPVSWCAKTGELFITQNDPNLSEKTRGITKEIIRLKIAITVQRNGKWGPLVDFPFNSSKYSVGHPAINATGDTLIFSSDIPGGFGKTDLYYSVRKDGKWGVPVNLGHLINTPEKEEFPFLTDQRENGRFLIFASDGRFGNGGFDLYSTKFPSDFREIVHFETPINTAYDDFSMNIPSGAAYGYLTSNRTGTGSDDIYKFTFKQIKAEPLKVLTNSQTSARELYVFDWASLRPISGVIVHSCDQKEYLTDASGKVMIKSVFPDNCEMMASIFGYSNQRKVLLSQAKEPNQIIRDTIWMNLLTDQKIILHNIYYDFDRYDILPESAKELDHLVALMKQNPEMKVELSSHTDSRGSEAYNLHLSELRAKAAVDYLVSKEINSGRIAWKGYGESQLIHQCIEPCSPAQQRENRRTELYIPEFLRGIPVKQITGDHSITQNELPLNSFADGNESKKKSSVKNDVEIVAVQKRWKYFVILGSFTREPNALDFLQQMKSVGYKAIILKESGPVRVGIGYYLLNQAKQSLSEIRTKNKGAWILIN